MASPVDRCTIGQCSEPRLHGTIACEAHWSLIPNKLKTQWQFVLGRMLRYTGTPRGEAAARDLHTIRLTVQEAIAEALEARRQNG